MINDIRTLAEWYPLLPPPGGMQAPLLAQQILDMHISLFLCASNIDDDSENVLDEITVTLIEVGDTTAKVLVTSIDTDLVWEIPEFDSTCTQQSDASHAVLNVYHGRDAHPKANENYIVLDESANISVPLQVNYRVHPDCFTVMQCAPMLLWEDKQPDQPPPRYTAVVDGWNTGVSFAGDTLTFNCNAGQGLGKLQPTQNAHVPVGLRSINGLTGTVKLEGVELEESNGLITIHVPLNTKPKCDPEEAEGAAVEDASRYPHTGGQIPYKATYLNRGNY